MPDCNEVLRTQGLPYPRTCARCGLGPCPDRARPTLTGTMTISLTPEEFHKIQLAQLRNGESLADTLLRLAGLRTGPSHARSPEIDPWLVGEADELARRGAR